MSRLPRALAAALLIAFAAPAAAQSGASKIVNFPAEKFNIAPGGVDMRSGRFVYSETDLSAGPLALTRTMPEKVANHANPFGNFSHNFDIFLLETRTDLYGGNPVGLDYRMNVHHGGRSFTFEGLNAGPGFAYKSDGPSAQLTFSGGDKASGNAVYRYEAGGTVLTFRSIGSADCADQSWGSGRRRCAFVSEMVEPDGTRYVFHYAATGGGATGNLARLVRVTSSRGYALLLEGSGHRVTKACVLNLALAGVPADGLCPANALATATYSYEPGGRLAQATGPGGPVSGFTYSAAPDQGGTMGFVKPGQTAPWLTNHIGYVRDEEAALQEIVLAQAFAGGQAYAYAFDHAPVTTHRPEPNIAGGRYTDAEGRETQVRYDFPLTPGSGPTTHCVPHPCEVGAPDDIFGYTYQQTPGPVEIVDPLGRRTVMDYCDPLLLASPPPYGGCAVYPVQWSLDPEGIKTVLDYDGQRNITKATRHPKPGVTNPDGTVPAPIVTEAGYDLVNPKVAAKPLWVRDARGNTTTWTYAPEHGGVLTETGPAVNGVTPQKRYSYVQRQARLSNGDVAGPAIYLLDRMAFCRTGNPAAGAGCALGAADEVVTSYDYGPDSVANNLLLRGQAVTADGITLRTCYAYDGQSRKISETSPNGTAGLTACPGAPPTAALPYTSSTRYDADGRVTGTIAPDPDPGSGPGQASGPLPFPAVRNSYDPAGRLTRVEQGALAAWQSDSVAPASWTGFTVHKVVDTQFDALDRKTREAIRGGGVTASVTEYGYDLAGRLKCTAVRMNPDAWATPLADKCVPGPAHATFGTDRITQCVYDAAGQLTETWEGIGTPLARREAVYTYNGNGRKKSLTDARGYRAEITYDPFDRQQRWIFPSKATPGVVDQSDYEQYGYDAAGNRTRLRKRDGSELTFTYDALNRMTAKLVPERAGLTPAQTRDVHYDYDLRGLQTKARFDSLTGEGVTTAYDGFGRVTSSTLLMAGVSRSIGHLYDSNGNRLRVTHPDAHFFTYDHDGLGRLKLVREDGGAALVAFAYDNAARRSGLTSGGVATGYSYDPAGRLESLNHNLTGPDADQVIGLAYNPASQIVQRTGTNIGYAWTGAVPVSRNYATNGQNQYTGATSNGTPSAAFGYDPNGNLTSDGTTSFTYDVENRLVSASGAKSATLTYDPLGRLWEVTSPTSGTTRFLHDDDALIAEYNSAGTLLHRYAHGSDKGVDDPLVWYDVPASGWRRALVADQQGSIVAVADMSGNPVAINAYDEYGIPQAGNAGRFQYTGQAWLAELGLYYYKARVYSPTLGRFLQIDPIGYDDQVNLYAYVGNDPVNATDPSGTTCVEAKGSYVCKVDRIVLPKGQKALTTAQAKKVRDFEKRYTAAVNRLHANNRTVLVGPTSGRKGTAFKANSRDIAGGLAKRTFVYRAGQSSGNSGMDSGKNYHGSWTNIWEPEMARGEKQMDDIAHEGLHRSPAEQYGNPLGPVLGNEPYNSGHQESYNKAAAEMLRPE